MGKYLHLTADKHTVKFLLWADGILYKRFCTYEVHLESFAFNLWQIVDVTCFLRIHFTLTCLMTYFWIENMWDTQVWGKVSPTSHWINQQYHFVCLPFDQIKGKSPEIVPLCQRGSIIVMGVMINTVWAAYWLFVITVYLGLQTETTKLRLEMINIIYIYIFRHF